MEVRGIERDSRKLFEICFSVLGEYLEERRVRRKKRVVVEKSRKAQYLP